MTEPMRTKDVVLIGIVRSLPEDAGVAVLVADEHVSAIETSIGAFERRLLSEAELAAELRDDDSR